MFSGIPAYTLIREGDFTDLTVCAYNLIHSTVNSVRYKSYGEERQKEQHCIFHYTVRGHGEVIYRGRSYITGPGEGFFNIINEKTSGYRYPKGYTEEWEFIVICFDGANVRDAVTRLMQQKVIYRIKDEPHFALMCRKLLERASSEMYVSFFPCLLSLLFAADREKSRLCEDFESIAKRDVLKNPLISTIAEEMGITREHLSREYSRQNHITPERFLRNTRFEKLCELLSTSMSIKEISALMHFPSVSGLSVFFKKIADVSPSAYRKNSSYLG